MSLVQGDAESIYCSLESIAENVIIEPYNKQGTNRSRRLGIFSSRHNEQTHLSLRFHGFIKRSGLQGFGNWNGTLQSAPKALLRLDLEGHGFRDAFAPQVIFMDQLRSHVAQSLSTEEAQHHEDSVLRFQHVLFRKAVSEDRNQPVTMSRGEDPRGMLRRIAQDWRLNQRPKLFKRIENGSVVETTAMAFGPGNFVEVVAYPVLIFKDGQGRTSDRAQVVLAMEAVTRLYDHMQLENMQIPAALLLNDSQDRVDDKMQTTEAIMPIHIPQDLLFTIARLLPDKNDVRSLSTVASQFTYPARKALFHDCCTNVGDQVHTMTGFTKVVSVQTSIRSSVVTLSLHGTRGLSPQGANTSAQEVADLVVHFTAPVSLTLAKFTWTPSQGLIPERPSISKLKHLTLDSITVISPRESPLEILRLADKWTNVYISDLDCQGNRAVLRSYPLIVHKLSIGWCPFHGDWTLGLQESQYTLQGITTLVFYDVITAQLHSIQQLVVHSKATLETLRVDLCGIFELTNLSAWNKFMKRIQLCVVLYRVQLTVPMHTEWYAPKPAERMTRGKHSEVLYMIAQSLPKTVASLHVKLVFGTHTTINDVKKRTGSISWAAFGEALRTHSALERFTLKLSMSKEYENAWTADEEQAFANALHWLPYTEGSLSSGELRMFRTPADSE
ncbi:hypothetical protein EIP86_010025 [Pleurotus ostreatoroseus]|nr:hypothetical protein EIP86_010025 [Pleurotus ostreatoroseus]